MQTQRLEKHGCRTIASSYQKLPQSDNSFENDRSTNWLGTIDCINYCWHTRLIYAPRCSQLKNEVIRQMRSEKIKFAMTY